MNEAISINVPLLYRALVGLALHALGSRYLRYGVELVGLALCACGTWMIGN